MSFGLKNQIQAKKLIMKNIQMVKELSINYQRNLQKLNLYKENSFHIVSILNPKYYLKKYRIKMNYSYHTNQMKVLDHI